MDKKWTKHAGKNILDKIILDTLLMIKILTIMSS